MSVQNKKLLRQLKKSFGSDDLSEVLSQLQSLIEPNSHNLPEEKINALSKLVKITEFVEKIEESYSQMDLRLDVASRNISISSKELSLANSNLASLNRSLKSMMDSLGEGYFVCGQDGICVGAYSKICEQIFGRVPSGVHISDLFESSEEDKELSTTWLDLFFQKRIPHEDLTSFAPSEYFNKDKEHFKVRYRSLYGDQDEVLGLVVVVTNDTSEINARKAAQRREMEIKRLLKIHKDKEQFSSFVKIFNDLILSFQEAANYSSDENLFELQGGLHSLKGLASSFLFFELEDAIHKIESQIIREMNSDQKNDLFAKIPGFCAELKTNFQTVVDQYEDILTSEKDKTQFSISRDSLAGIFEKLQAAKIPQADLQDIFLDVCGTEIHSLISGFDSSVQITAKRLGKKMNKLRLVGQNFKIIPSVYNEVFASLVHAFRNAVDHGIESPENRIAAEKPVEGNIEVHTTLYTAENKEWLEIKIVDDGGGVNIERLRKKLIAVNPKLELANEETLLRSLLEIGVSTQEEVTTTSGRGIGLSALNWETKKLGGCLELKSFAGRGSELAVRIPLIIPMETVYTRSQLSNFSAA